MDSVTNKFPPQQLPFKQKGKAWRKKCVDFACDHTFLSDAANRKSALHKQINYNLLDGILDMNDLEIVLNPTHLRDDLVPQTIQHYPIMNSKLNVLIGEESKRLFDFRVVVTDPNSISEASNLKKQEVFADLQQLIEDTAISDEDYQNKIYELGQYYTYTWQDLKEKRANYLLNQFNKEDDFRTLFNEGFKDAVAVGEEIYILDIVSGEPVISRLDPRIVTAISSSNSSRFEDADMIIIDDYWSPGKIFDTFYDVLTAEDRKYIQDLSDYSTTGEYTDDMGNWRESPSYRYAGEGTITDPKVINSIFSQVRQSSISDFNGNIRVTRVFWKSRRKIKKITSYDPTNGEEVVNFFPETYVPNTDMGEKEETYWINEAWEGTRIGEKIYVNIRPRPIQYNRLSNPSLCHFGIIGSIYARQGSQPYSLVDMMKPFNYLYDVVHDRLNRALARNYGKITELDMAKIPDGWSPEKWLYWIRRDKIAVTNSFNEGKVGAATGKLAGALNNASRGVIDLDEGNTIQQYINILDYIKLEMSEVVGISKQREGQIANRETVGGVERATLQSSHITEPWFTIHDNLKKRVLDAFIETAKIAMKGRNKKFSYILPDYAQVMVDIDGDEFAESDYGVVVDNSQQSQELAQKMEMLVQAGLQNQQISFSTALKMFSTCSLAEKMRMIENNEREIQQRAQQEQQMQMQVQQEQLQAQAQTEQQKMALEDALNERDNDTKLTIAILQANAQEEVEPESNESKEALLEKMREFDLKLQLDRDRLNFDKDKADKDRAVKKQQISAKKQTTSK